MSIETTPEANRTVGPTPAAPWRINAISRLPDTELAATFQDGLNGIVDFSAVNIAREVCIFSPLRDLALFEQARLE